MKRAEFISKSCELQQEFSFAHPKTVLQTHQIFNLHFTGSPIWNMFCSDFVKLENTWNVTIRKIFQLPLQAHRYLIEPISKVNHLKIVLAKRFVSFLRQILSSKKAIPKQLLNAVMFDTRCTTGNNLRNIFLLTKKFNLSELSSNSIEDISFNPLPDDERWRISVIEEMIDFKYGQVQVDGFTLEECENILTKTCVY